MSIIYRASWLKYAGSERAQRSHEQHPSHLQETPLHASWNRPGRTLMSIDSEAMQQLLESHMLVQPCRGSGVQDGLVGTAAVLEGSGVLRDGES